MRLFLLVLAVWVRMWETWWSPPSVCQWHPCRQLYGKFGRCLSHGAQGQPLRGCLGWLLPELSGTSCVWHPCGFLESPASTLASFQQIQQQPQGQLSSEFHQHPGGSFLPTAGPWLGTFSLPALAHMSRPWLLACLTDQLWPRAT